MEDPWSQPEEAEEAFSSRKEKGVDNYQEIKAITGNKQFKNK